MASFNPAQVAVQPIASLNPFLGGKFWIKARAIDKGDIRTWNKATTGKLFSCTFVDETAAIRATFFNEQVDSFFTLIENGKVFYINGGSVKNANRKFNNVNNEYELTADSNTQIHLARDAATNIPTQRYNFVPIQTLAQKEENSPVDVLGIVTKVSPTTKIVSKKTQEELTKRDVTIGDTSAAIDITFWNDQAIAFSHDVGAVLAMKNVKVRHFQGVTLSTSPNTTIDVSPAIPDTESLKRWYQTTGGTSKSLSGQGRDGGETLSLGRRYFRQIDTEGLGRGEKPDYVTVRCVPTFIKTDSLMYDACPTCNKKVVPLHDTARCEKCNTDVKSSSRYMCSMQFSDGVTSKWVTMFNEGAEVFWGCPADVLKAEAAADATSLQKRAQHRLYRPLLLSVRVKEERGMTMQDGTQLEDRVRLTATRVEDFLYPATGKHSTATECDELVSAIQAFHV